ncbi:MAG: putative porin [Nitrospinae bacterium]|nr:putative porin [Nitrospinota bacterium]
MNRKNFFAIGLMIAALSVSIPVKAEMSEQELRLRVLEEKLESKSKGLEWIDHFTFKNDLRLRHESNYNDKNASGAEVQDQHRERFRLRLGGEYEFDKSLKVGLRLASGSTDPISTNQTFNNSFGKKNFNIDSAFANYVYSFRDLKTSWTGGKFDTPFFSTLPLVWDKDLTMEGLAESFTLPVGSSTTLFAVFGQMAIEESSSVRHDPYLAGYQGGVEQKLGSLGKLKAAIAYFDYISVKGKTIANNPSAGNTLSGTSLVNDYDIFNANGKWTFDGFAVPVEVMGEYANNTAGNVPANEDEAYAFGVGVGKKIKDFGDWYASYQYRVLEKDGALDAFTDSDFHGGGTNGKGSVLGLKFGLRKGVELNATYFIAEANTGAEVSRDRLQLDAIFHF